MTCIISIVSVIILDSLKLFPPTILTLLNLTDDLIVFRKRTYVTQYNI